MSDDGIELAPDEEVQGGALTCSARSTGSPSGGPVTLLFALSLVGLLFRRKAPDRSP
jgi:MYXO-CTERM domain-containing protein